MTSAPAPAAVRRGPGRPRLPREERVVGINVGVPPNIREWIEQEADRRGTSMSQVVTLALAQAAQAG